MAIGRVCSNRLVAAKGRRRMLIPVQGFQLLPSKQPFCNVDVSGMVFHPSHFCSSCKNVLDKITSANENKMLFRSTRDSARYGMNSEALTMHI